MTGKSKFNHRDTAVPSVRRHSWFRERLQLEILDNSLKVLIVSSVSRTSVCCRPERMVKVEVAHYNDLLLLVYCAKGIGECPKSVSCDFIVRAENAHSCVGEWVVNGQSDTVP